MRLRLFPIRSGHETTIRLATVEPLPAGAPWHWRPLVALPRDVRPPALLTVTIADKPVWAESPEVSWQKDTTPAGLVLRPADDAAWRRGFTLLWQQSAAPLATLLTHRRAGAPRGQFLLYLTAPSIAAARPIPRDIVFLLDRSGSMAEEDRFDRGRRALVQAIAALEPHDRFAIALFGTGLDAYASALLPADAAAIAGATAWLAEQRPRGATNLHAALAFAASALGTADPARLPLVVLLSDGRPTVGPRDEPALLAALAPAAEARLFALGVGDDLDADLLQRLASGRRGHANYLPGGPAIEPTVAHLMSSLAGPAIAAPTIAVTGAVRLHEPLPAPLPDLYTGQPLLVAGEYSGAGAATLTLSGLANGTPWRSTVALNFPASTGPETAAVRTLWAHRRVGWLSEQIRRNGGTNEALNELRALALEHGIVTPWTSLIALPDTPVPTPAQHQFGRAPAIIEEQLKTSRSAPAATADRAGRLSEALFAGIEMRRTPEGTWRQHEAPRPLRTLTIEWMSDEYIQLYIRQPAMRPLLDLGPGTCFVWEGLGYRLTTGTDRQP
jgi:Ca-activated chloride channel family protein